MKDNYVNEDELRDMLDDNYTQYAICKDVTRNLKRVLIRVN